MTLHETQLVAYAAGTVIHGALLLLVLRLYRQTAGDDRIEAVKRVALCTVGFCWQFGNLWDRSRLFHPILGNLLWYCALVTFPLLLGYAFHRPMPDDPRTAVLLARLGRVLQWPLLIFTPLTILSAVMFVAGRHPLIDLDLAIRITMNTMLFYFVLFIVIGLIRRRSLRASGQRPLIRMNRTIIVLMPITAILFTILLYYPGALKENSSWLELAAGMMSIPSTIGTAYRLYRFPFMDVFLREVLTGVTLLTMFCVGFSIAPNSDWMPLWIATLALGLAVARAPISRRVERTFLGYGESAEEQEERVGAAIRNVDHLEGFDEEAGQILQKEVDAEWVKVSVAPATDAAATFQIADSPPQWLSLGPRKNLRTYMSRHLRLARSSALQIAAQRQRLKREESERRGLVEQHELRETTARAQMRALQAQINPHFLFNTLNTLAALIESNPGKAERVTEDLAEVFRYALDSTRLDSVKLEDELRFLESYLAIEKARFDSRLSYSFDVDPAARNHSIPPMILQPLVENAVRHGIGQKIEGGEVRVIARVEANGLILRIEDTGVGFVRERPGGVGLTNTRERLKHACGDEAEFRIERLEPEGTRMEIVLKH